MLANRRRAADTPNLAAQGKSVSRKTVAEVSLAGLSFSPRGDYGWLNLAGAAANGNQQNQQITLTFTDGSTATWTQSFSDWCGPQNYAGETIIQQQPNRVNQVGNVHSQTNYVYGYAYQIPAGKMLASMKLPNNTNKFGILGMSML